MRTHYLQRPNGSGEGHPWRKADNPQFSICGRFQHPRRNPGELWRMDKASVQSLAARSVSKSRSTSPLTMSGIEGEELISMSASGGGVIQKRTQGRSRSRIDRVSANSPRTWLIWAVKASSFRQRSPRLVKYSGFGFFEKRFGEACQFLSQAQPITSGKQRASFILLCACVVADDYERLRKSPKRPKYIDGT